MGGDEGVAAGKFFVDVGGGGGALVFEAGDTNAVRADGGAVEVVVGGEAEGAVGIYLGAGRGAVGGLKHDAAKG